MNARKIENVYKSNLIYSQDKQKNNKLTKKDLSKENNFDTIYNKIIHKK